MNQLNRNKNNLKISFHHYLNTSSNEPKSKIKLKNKDIIEEIIHKRKDVEIEKELILYGPSLTIIEENGNLLLSKEIKINPGGLETNLQCINNNNNNTKSKNGLVLFGSTNSKRINVPLNFNSNERSQYEKFPYLFGVFFVKETKTYYIQPYLGDGTYNLLFVKLYGGQELIISNKEVINIGGGIFQINIIDESTISVTVVSIINDSGVSESVLAKRTFNKDEVSQISFGRDESCTFAFPSNKNFSRKQAIIFYRNGCWVIKDGNGTRGSTNGSWVLGIHPFKISENLIVEILSSKFKFVLQHNNKK
jgi:hypothetical protein